MQGVSRLAVTAAYRARFRKPIANYSSSPLQLRFSTAKAAEGLARLIRTLSVCSTPVGRGACNLDIHHDRCRRRRYPRQVALQPAEALAIGYVSVMSHVAKYVSAVTHAAKRVLWPEIAQKRRWVREIAQNRRPLQPLSNRNAIGCMRARRNAIRYTGFVPETQSVAPPLRGNTFGYVVPMQKHSRLRCPRTSEHRSCTGAQSVAPCPRRNAIGRAQRAVASAPSRCRSKGARMSDSRRKPSTSHTAAGSRATASRTATAPRTAIPRTTAVSHANASRSTRPTTPAGDDRGESGRAHG